jgi:hypothetical protein
VTARRERYCISLQHSRVAPAATGCRRWWRSPAARTASASRVAVACGRLGGDRRGRPRGACGDCVRAVVEEAAAEAGTHLDRLADVGAPRAVAVDARCPSQAAPPTHSSSSSSCTTSRSKSPTTSSRSSSPSLAYRPTRRGRRADRSLGRRPGAYHAVVVREHDRGGAIAHFELHEDAAHVGLHGCLG